MSGSPEVLRSEPQIKEKQEEFIVPETLQNSGVQVVQKNFKAQVKDDLGTPLIQTPPTQVISIAPPAGQQVLVSWAKGPITSSLSWLGAFWLRVIKKAIYFGWKVIGGQQ